MTVFVYVFQIADYHCLGIRVCLFLRTISFVLLAHLIQFIYKTEQPATHTLYGTLTNEKITCIVLLLLIAGDISPNPGPETVI